MTTLMKFVSGAMLTLSSSFAFAGVVVAPTNRIALFTPIVPYYYIQDSNYTVGSTTAMGSISSLKSNPTVVNALNVLDYTPYPGSFKDTTMFNGSAHQGITENYNGGYLKQCVAFARAMTGTSYQTTRWYTGDAISNHLVRVPGGYVLSSMGQNSPLKPGTMIGHFGGKSVYSQNSTTPHVALFLSWIISSGYVTGMNVVNQNLVDTISINGTIVTAVGQTGVTNGMIQKHQLPIACNAGSLCTSDKRYNNPRFWALNYHVIDAR
jgi:hypothetical protein